MSFLSGGRHVITAKFPRAVHVRSSVRLTGGWSGWRAQPRSRDEAAAEVRKVDNQRRHFGLEPIFTPISMTRRVTTWSSTRTGSVEESARLIAQLVSSPISGEGGEEARELRHHVLGQGH